MGSVEARAGVFAVSPWRRSRERKEIFRTRPRARRGCSGGSLERERVCVGAGPDFVVTAGVVDEGVLLGCGKEEDCAEDNWVCPEGPAFGLVTALLALPPVPAGNEEGGAGARMSKKVFRGENGRSPPEPAPALSLAAALPMVEMNGCTRRVALARTLCGRRSTTNVSGRAKAKDEVGG